MTKLFRLPVVCCSVAACTQRNGTSWAQNRNFFANEVTDLLEIVPYFLVDSAVESMGFFTRIYFYLIMYARGRNA